MILEHAILEVKAGYEAAFEAAMIEAAPLIAASPGFLGLEVKPCLEKTGRYLLLVQWTSVEAHEVGFRGSDRYQIWRALLHGFYEPFPLVQHYGKSIVA